LLASSKKLLRKTSLRTYHPSTLMSDDENEELANAAVVADEEEEVETTLPPVKKKKRGRRDRTFDRYIYGILKAVEPNVGIANNAMIAINGILSGFLDRQIKKSFDVVAYDKKSTLKSRHACAAAKLLLTGGLRDHGAAAGNAAVAASVAAA